MKHDVKTGYNISDKRIAELLDAGYKLIGFSCGSDTDLHGDIMYSEVCVFSKVIEETF